MRLPVALAAFLVLACGPAQGTGSNASSSRTDAPTASASSSASSSAEASADASCRLPVASGGAPIDGNPAHGERGRGGFVQVPGGTFTNDPQSLGAYDRAQSRWVPAFRASIAPDGHHYAFPEFQTGTGPRTGIIHVAEVGTGADRSIHVPGPSNVIDYASEGIYLSHVVPNSDAAPAGLGLLDPATGSFRQITAEKVWLAIGGGSAWGVDQDPNAAPARANGPGGAYNRVVRLNLGDGSISGWYSSGGNNVWILGLDGSGLPVVSVVAGGTFTVRASGDQVYSAPAGNNNPSGPAVTDSHGTWFGSPGGTVWLYRPHAQLQAVASLPFQGVLIGGACS